MRKIILYMTMSLDGFLAGPKNELDWMGGTPDDDEMNKDVLSVMKDVDTGVIGYPTGSGMIPYWAGVAKNPSASKAERELARAIGKLHGILISTKPEEAVPENAELLVVRNDKELVEAMEKLKRQSGRNIGVPGGVRTAQTFSRLGLVDEYVLMVHPVAIGEGKRLFTQRTNLDLVGSRTYDSGVIQVRYRPRTNQERGK